MIRRISALMGLALLVATGTAFAQTPGPTLAEAKKAMIAAQNAAMKMNTRLSCVILDSRGDVIAAERMDMARYFTINVATGKARAAATFGQPSAALGGMAAMRIDQAIDGPQMLFIQGAVPITRNNQVVGAMGCSGGSGQQDEDAAKAGIAAMQ